MGALTGFAGTVCFSIEEAHICPDFIFAENEEDFVALDQIQTIEQWDPKNEHSLRNILVELMEKYKVPLSYPWLPKQNLCEKGIQSVESGADCGSQIKI